MHGDNDGDDGGDGDGCDDGDGDDGDGDDAELLFYTLYIHRGD